jgi:hypothetical protein
MRCNITSSIIYCQPFFHFKRRPQQNARAPAAQGLREKLQYFGPEAEYTRKSGVIEELLRTRYGHAQQVTLVCDNLNTHKKGAFYEVFTPEQCRSILHRLAFCYTPKHGSWLNIAENELSSLTRQCLSRRRIPSLKMLRKETAAWASSCNSRQRGVDWQFTIEDARQKLKSLYPKVIV